MFETVRTILRAQQEAGSRTQQSKANHQKSSIKALLSKVMIRYGGRYGRDKLGGVNK